MILVIAILKLKPMSKEF